MATTTARPRLVGSGNTVFHWQGQPIAFANMVSVTSPQPVAQAQVIQPLYAQRPLEILTPEAITNGSLILHLTSLYGESVWQRLSAELNNSQDVIDIMRTLAINGPDNAVKITRIIKPFGTQNSNNWHVETYYGCVIVNVTDGEEIRIDTMSLDKQVEVWYTWASKNWINGGRRQHELSVTG